MKRSAHRRAVLAIAGAAAVTAAAGPVIAQLQDIRGVVTLSKSALVPEGHLEIYLEDPAITDNARRIAERTRIDSDGKAKSIAFSFSTSANSTASPTLRLVARLERTDGWLIARGSAPLKTGSPVHITLKTVTY